MATLVADPVTEPDVWSEMNAIRETLSRDKRIQIDQHMAMASGYVFGMEDAGKIIDRPAGTGWRFMCAYGLHVAKFEAGHITCRWALRDAFEAWASGREIGVWAHEVVKS